MPMKLNVGASRKVADQNYCSRGASVNLEIELDSTLISDSGKLQERIRQLFSLVRTSLDEELNGGTNGKLPAQSSNGTKPPPAQNGQSANGRKPANTPRVATSSQVKALFAITRNQQIDLAELLQERFNVRRPDDLNIQQASDLIGELKSSSPTGG